MTRKKVKLVWIVNDAARKASLKKRRIGLLKKVSELTTLCGVSAFVVIYSPDEAEPMLWPSRPVVQQMLMRYQNIPEIDRCKKTMNQELYLKERMGKIQEQSKKSQKKNREVEMSYLMDKLHYQGNGVDDFETGDTQILIWLLEERMRDMRKRVEYFQQVPPLLPPGYEFLPPPPPQGDHNMEEMGQTNGGSEGGDQIRNNNPTDAMSLDQWFLDMINNNEGFSGGGVDVGDLGLGLSLPLPHSTFTIGNSSGGDNGNAAFGMGLPFPPMGGNSFGLGLPDGNTAGNNNVKD
ncbi:mads box protein, putative [Ricinus communis]|uniref:Mads box protein, putative n=1 Tax=Ricinus communis TaxID=3988 RepID=B9SDK7_RICCO|nr:mads box protein, putative [Ricinus communis]